MSAAYYPMPRPVAVRVWATEIAATLGITLVLALAGRILGGETK